MASARLNYDLAGIGSSTGWSACNTMPTAGRSAPGIQRYANGLNTSGQYQSSTRVSRAIDVQGLVERRQRADSRVPRQRGRATRRCRRRRRRKRVSPITNDAGLHTIIYRMRKDGPGAPDIIGVSVAIMKKLRLATLAAGLAAAASFLSVAPVQAQALSPATTARRSTRSPRWSTTVSSRGASSTSAWA